MAERAQAVSSAISERLREAINAHDLQAMLALFDVDYRSEQPVHPNRGFGGREQVDTNWSTIFADVPDFRADLLRSASADGAEWGEWRFSGTRAEGEPLRMAGVILMGLRGGLISWGRLYMEAVEEAGENIDRAVKGMTGGD